MTLISDVRACGLLMGTVYRTDGGRGEGTELTERVTYVGWTTDEGKAGQAQVLGARVIPCPSRDPQFSGWEVIVVDRA